MTSFRRIGASPLLITFGVLLALFAAGSIAFPNFASFAVVRNLLVDNAFLGIAAVGATFVILSGGIDLSVGSVMAFTTILVASLIERGHIHPLAAFAVALAAGSLFGALQGFLIVRFELPPFLVTLAGLFFARGAAFVVFPQSIGIKHPFVDSTLNDALSIPLAGTTIRVTVPLVLLTLVLAWLVLRHTRFGRAAYAIGDDSGAATLMGLPVARTRLRIYALSGFLSALAGIAFTLYKQSGDPASCKGMELDAIAAVVIGGTLLRGGVGTVVGSFAGVLILGLIQTLISFQGSLSSWWTSIVVGGLVLVFLVTHRMLSRLASPDATP